MWLEDVLAVYKLGAIDADEPAAVTNCTGLNESSTSMLNELFNKNLLYKSLQWEETWNEFHT